jgi:hypothetical protein
VIGRPQLADVLALAIMTHGPSPGSKLARCVGARKQAVLDELRANPLFEQIGRGRGSRWRLAGNRIDPTWEPLGTEVGGGPGQDAPDRLDALERRVAALERQRAETEAPS